MQVSSFTNAAAWIPAKGAGLEIGPSEISEPGADGILVRNHAWGVNPIDWKIQSFGVMLEQYPAITGFDVAGEVVVVGSRVEKFKARILCTSDASDMRLMQLQVGDRVIAHPLGLQTKRTAEDGFQLYTIVQARAAVKLPETMSYAEGVKLPLGILTASAALYNKEHLQLPLPTTDPRPTGKTLLVWGGSSNVGIAAVQLAVASGVEVVAVASQKNWEVVRQAGAVFVFDQNDADATGDLVECLRGREVAGAFDGKRSAQTYREKSADRIIAIGSIEATEGTAHVLAQLGGGRLRSVFNKFSSVNATVEAKQGRSFSKRRKARSTTDNLKVQATSVFFSEPDTGKAVWEDFVPAALEKGQIKPLLRTAIAGEGLESIQEGVNMVKAGVSGTKVVVVA